VKVKHYWDYWYSVLQTEMRMGGVVVVASEDYEI
jgi:hypothetical protein